MDSLAPYDNVVVKSPMDKRSYRTVHLSNGLSALLVHDPEIYPEGYPPQSEGQDLVGGGEGRGCTGEEGDGEEKEANREINGDGSDGKAGTRKTGAASSPTKQDHDGSSRTCFKILAKIPS